MNGLVCLLLAKTTLMGCGYWEIAAHKKWRRELGIFTAKSEEKQQPHTNKNSSFFRETVFLPKMKTDHLSLHIYMGLMVSLIV